MTFLSASWLLVCDENFTIIKDGAIAFDDTIKFVGTIEELEQNYPNAHIEYQGKNSILMPGLINSHIHLEFSANKTTLEYGNFVNWLFSVIENRESLMDNTTLESIIATQFDTILQSGTTTIGAISSYGFDMNLAIASAVNVVYFTEVLGSQANMIDAIFADFQAKLNEAIKNQSDNFIPAIAIHSPYSTHPVLIREVLKIAKDKNLRVSAHFLESDAEKQWLENSKGDFEPFFNNLLKQTQSLTTPIEFLEQFDGIKTLSFTHCVEAKENELKKIKELNGSIIHCATSNRLLTNNTLNIESIKDINISIGTDGLSSNNSLNMFDELRNTLMIHTNQDINKLSKKLLLYATKGGAKTLGLNKGSLKVDFDADIISFCLPQKTEEKNIPTSIILHTKNVNKVYIKGENEYNI